jgi:hypothetical protein
MLALRHKLLKPFGGGRGRGEFYMVKGNTPVSEINLNSGFAITDAPKSASKPH